MSSHAPELNFADSRWRRHGGAPRHLISGSWAWPRCGTAPARFVYALGRARHSALSGALTTVRLGPGAMEAVLPDGLRYVGAEGVQGAGASRLAGLIAGRLYARQVLENPFPERFDEDRARRAVQARRAFLVKRFRLRKVIHARGLFHRLSAADFTFEKDRVNAHFCPAEDEFALRERLDRAFQQIRRRESSGANRTLAATPTCTRAVRSISFATGNGRCPSSTRRTFTTDSSLKTRTSRRMRRRTFAGPGQRISGCRRAA